MDRLYPIVIVILSIQMITVSIVNIGRFMERQNCEHLNNTTCQWVLRPTQEPKP